MLSHCHVGRGRVHWPVAWSPYWQPCVGEGRGEVKKPITQTREKKSSTLNEPKPCPTKWVKNPFANVYKGSSWYPRWRSWCLGSCPSKNKPKVEPLFHLKNGWDFPSLEAPFPAADFQVNHVQTSGVYPSLPSFLFFLPKLIHRNPTSKTIEANCSWKKQELFAGMVLVGWKKHVKNGSIAQGQSLDGRKGPGH